MTRGAKRKFNPSIPRHIDQGKLPKGIYWDPSGNGRWYVKDAHPEVATEAGDRRRHQRAAFGRYDHEFQWHAAAGGTDSTLDRGS